MAKETKETDAQQQKDSERLKEAAFAKANPDKVLIYDVKTRTKVPVKRSECQVNTVTTKRGDRLQVVGTYRPTDGTAARKVFRFVSKDFKL